MFIDRRIPGAARRWFAEPPDWRMRIPDPLKKCAVFLGVNQIPGVEALARYAGTGFLVAIEQEGERFAYIVTARHVVEDMNRYTKNVPRTSFARLNDYNGNAFQVSLAGSAWILSPDNMVDLAICPIPIPNQGLTLVPTTAFVQPSQFSEFGIGIGDEVFSVGLLSFVVSEKSNVPVVRYGTIAMLPDEPVLTKQGPREVYLVEARSLGGLSGSPVFVRETVVFDLATQAVKDGEVSTVPAFVVGRTFLFGVMRGHWDIDPETLGSTYIETKKKNEGGVNFGIAMVTPASKVLDILHGPILTALREEQMKKKRAKKRAELPEETLDTALSDVPKEPFDPAVSALFQVPKGAIKGPSANHPKRSRKKR